MNDLELLLEQARSLGASFDMEGERVIVGAPSPLPHELMQSLREHKCEIISHLRRVSRQELRCAILEEWRRVSIPEWREILQKAIDDGDSTREEYARWMLNDILLDPDYTEPQE